MTIIAISGFIGSGKDTVADYLVNVHGFRRESFAGTLKDAISVIFGWDKQLLEGRTKQSREWREQIDVWWADRLDIPHLTPRWVLQHWGTDVMRQHFHDDIWLASLENKLRKTNEDIVVSDVRFTNEIKMLKKLGAITVKTCRGEAPIWANSLEQIKDHYERQSFMQQYESHQSEWNWVGTEFDYTLDNNGSMDNLYTQINNLLLHKLIICL